MSWRYTYQVDKLCKRVIRQLGIRTRPALSCHHFNLFRACRHPPVFFIPQCGVATTGTTDVSIVASPRFCLHDVPTQIKVHGLEPNDPVTLRACLYEEKGRLFVSHAHYHADEVGQVDVWHDKSAGGSYKGIFPAGLLSTLKPGPEEFKFSRLIKRDIFSPWQINVTVHKGHEGVGESSPPLASVKLERHLLAPGVKRIPVRHGRVRGVLYIPAGVGPFPGIIDLFGGIGGLVEFRAAMLASRGVAALALAYFGYEDLPSSWNFDLEYFEEAVEYLLSQPDIVPDRCGVLGISLGGFMSMIMGTWLEKVKAVVSINGPPSRGQAAVSYKGQCLFDSQALSYDVFTIDNEQRVLLKPERVYDILASGLYFIPVEKASDDTQFLLIAGEQDTWQCQHGNRILERIMKKNSMHNVQLKIYPNTGHIIEPPYSPYVEHSYQSFWGDEENRTANNSKGVFLKWGGEPEGTCRAQEDMWLRIQTFFTNYIRDCSSWYQQCLQERSGSCSSC